MRVSLVKEVDDAIIALLEKPGLAKWLSPRHWFIRVEYAFERAYPVLVRFMPHLYELPGKVVISSTHKIEEFETVRCGYVMPWSMFLRQPNVGRRERVIIYAGHGLSDRSPERRGLHILLKYGELIRKAGLIPTIIAWSLPPGVDASSWDVQRQIPYSKVLNLLRDGALILHATAVDGWSRFNWLALRAGVPILQLDRKSEFTRASREWAEAAGVSLPIASSEEEFECMLMDALKREDTLYVWRGAWQQVQDAHPLLFDERSILRWFRDVFGDIPPDLAPFHDLPSPIPTRYSGYWG